MTDDRTESNTKSCPFTGGICQHRESCDGPNVVKCWARHLHRASQPDGPDGLHRDSMS